MMETTEIQAAVADIVDAAASALGEHGATADDSIKILARAGVMLGYLAVLTDVGPWMGDPVQRQASIDKVMAEVRAQVDARIAETGFALAASTTTVETPTAMQ